MTALKRLQVAPGLRRLLVGLGGLLLVGAAAAVVSGGDPVLEPAPGGTIVGGPPCQGTAPAAQFPTFRLDGFAAPRLRLGGRRASSPGRPTPRANTSPTRGPSTCPSTASASTTSWTCSIA